VPSAYCGAVRIHEFGAADWYVRLAGRVSARRRCGRWRTRTSKQQTGT
jgi:hypothetical protein